MLATRQVGAFLSLMVVQEREDGETLVSVMPLPYGLALLTWLAGAWLALWPVLSRLSLEAGWLVEDTLAWLNTLAGTVGTGLGLVEGIAVRFYVTITALEILARSLWWAAR